MNFKTHFSSIDRSFSRGYFCAVKNLLYLEGGCATTHVKELFNSGGNPSLADELDQNQFIAAGLMKDPKKNHERTPRITSR